MFLIETMIGAIGGASVALIVASYLGRRFIDIQISRVTDTYKAQLEQRSATLKTELSIYAHEQIVGLSRLDAQRSAAMVKIWDILIDWHEALMELGGPEVEVKDNPLETCVRHINSGARLKDHAGSFGRTLNRSVLFFNEDTFNRIQQCSDVINLATSEYCRNVVDVKAYGIATEQEAIDFLPIVLQESFKIRNRSKENLNALREALAGEFRVLMTAKKGS